MESNLNLQGKVALITGSTRGIGWACAQALAQHGATILLNGHQNPDLLRQRVEEIAAQYSVPAEGFSFDVGDAPAVKATYSTIFNKHRRLDILVNNAGIFEGALLGMVSTELSDRMFRTNVQGVLWNMQFASRLMARNKTGSIVNLSSIIGRVGTPGQVLYSGTKAAVIGMTLSAAKELASLGIRVNAVAPGFIDTEMVRHLPQPKREEVLRNINMQRLGTPEDVAKVVLFLASDLAAYVTGQVLGVDGGMVM